MLAVQTACAVQSRSLMVYLANTNQTSLVVLVIWHAHYVVNIELICSTLCTLAPCSYIFVFDFFLCVCLFFCFSIIASSFLVNTGEHSRCRCQRHLAPSEDDAVELSMNSPSTVAACTAEPAAQPSTFTPLSTDCAWIIQRRLSAETTPLRASFSTTSDFFEGV